MNKNEHAEPAIQDPKTENLDARTEADPNRRLSRWCSGLSVAAWGLHLFVTYSLVEWHCRTLALEDITVKVILYAVTAVLFLVAAFCTMISRTKVQKEEKQISKKKEGLFSLTFTTWLSGFLSAVILVQGLPVFLVSLCIV